MLFRLLLSVEMQMNSKILRHRANLYFGPLEETLDNLLQDQMLNLCSNAAKIQFQFAVIVNEVRLQHFMAL